MGGTGIQELAGIVRADAAADHQPAGPLPQRGKRLGFRLFIVWTVLRVQQDHMSAGQPVRAVEICVPGSVHFRDKVLLCPVARVGQTSADDLLYASVMNIDAWPESHCLSSRSSSFSAVFSVSVFSVSVFSLSVITQGIGTSY